MTQHLGFALFWLPWLLLSCSSDLMGQRTAHDPNAFGCSSSHYMLDDFQNQPTALSPDNAKAVQLTKKCGFRVISGKRVISDFNLPDMSANVEVGWSPDSSQFFISYSDGGAVGGYHVYLYSLVGGTIRPSDIPRKVAQRFRVQHWCQSRGNNLFFLGWTADSKLAFLVGEVYPTSDCGKELGQYRGYEVRVSDGKILHVFDEKETDSIEKNCRDSGRLALPSY